METAVSSIAAVLTTAAFIPQAYKIIHTRETKGVSLWMHITFAIGVAFWFTRRDATELANDAVKRSDLWAHGRDRYHEAPVSLIAM
jgi:uncharacterized protein with PQ loop repeat